MNNRYGDNRDQGWQEPAQIPSPYNFVPLSDNVFFPGWADQVSQDIPFSDGISGILEIEIKAKTPIYIRNGGVWPERPDDRMKCAEFNEPFKTPDGTYAIPGTSLKGMLRSLVEIISFGKMSKTNHHRYGIRDLNNKDRRLYSDHFTTNTSPHECKSHAGWLQKDNEGKWIIHPCKFARIEVRALEDFHPSKPDLHSKQSASDKYHKWGNLPLEVDFASPGIQTHEHSCNANCRCMKKKNLLLMYEKASSIMKGTRGTIVFTGQPSDYRIGGRHKKHLEFLFYDVKDHAIGIQHLKKDFKFIHSDDKGVPNKEWNFWARKLDKGERVPIFYLVDGTGIPFAMGLAMMFRLPYKNSIDDAISHSSATHTKSTPDLSELIFGHINENGALRGRVQFGLFKAENHPAPMETYIAVLGSPKPTFYPNYIRQNLNSASGKINGNYITYMDDNCKIAGWKRYPVRADATIPDKDELISLIPENEKTKAKNFDVATSFKPLSSGTKFSGKLKFHNLRPMELGALLWALRFGSNGNLRHNIGMAKPLGFGSVTMKIRNQSLPNEIDLDKVCSDFEKLMVMKYPGWRDSDQIKELLAMADPRRSDESVLNYPSLANKDFSNFKKDNAALIPYSQMTIVKQSRLAKPNGLKQDSPELELPEISPAVKLIKTVKNNINGNASELKKMLNQLSSITEKEYDELGKLISRRNDYSNEYAQTTRDYKNAYNDLKKKILKPQ